MNDFLFLSIGAGAVMLLVAAPRAQAQPAFVREENTELLITELPGPDSSFPQRLSELPALLAAGSGAGHTVAGVIPYRPSSQLWSDNARKERYLALPGLEQIIFQSAQGWSMPEGTVIVKNFSMPLDERSPEASLKRLETRIMLFLEGEWHGYSYEWNEDETDAVLLEGSKQRPLTITDPTGTSFDYAWYYPSRTDCFQCHTPAANFTLGLQTPQMNSLFTYPRTGQAANQLEALNGAGSFTTDIGPAHSHAAMPDYHDAGASLRDRSRAYLASNCSMCHQPESFTRAQLDLRWETPDEQSGLIDEWPVTFDFGFPDPRILKPGDPGQSVLIERLQTTQSFFRMPPLATSRVDQEAVDLITAWTLELGQQQNGHGDAWQLF